MTSVSTEALRNFDQSQSDYNTAVTATQRHHGQKMSPSDGMTFTCASQLVFGGLTDASLYSWKPSEGEPVGKHQKVGGGGDADGGDDGIVMLMVVTIASPPRRFSQPTPSP